MKKPQKTPCPCGSGQTYNSCCAPYLNAEKPAPTAEKLMRSRYSAYVLAQIDYLFNSWHPDTCPDKTHIAEGIQATKWRGLKIINSRQGLADDTEGWVSFQARYKRPNQAAEKISENSYFKRINNKWLYHSNAFEN